MTAPVSAIVGGSRSAFFANTGITSFRAARACLVAAVTVVVVIVVVAVAVVAVGVVVVVVVAISVQGFSIGRDIRLSKFIHY